MLCSLFIWRGDITDTTRGHALRIIHLMQTWCAINLALLTQIRYTRCNASPASKVRGIAYHETLAGRSLTMLLDSTVKHSVPTHASLTDRNLAISCQSLAAADPKIGVRVMTEKRSSSRPSTKEDLVSLVFTNGGFHPSVRRWSWCSRHHGLHGLLHVHHTVLLHRHLRCT